MNIGRLAEKAQLLRLSARSIAESMRGGAYASRFRGQGIEFDTVREYEQGDDIRSIDWNVTARSNKAYIKLYKEEREVPVFIVLDNSLSMQTGGGGRIKKDLAFEAAVLLAFAAEFTSSPVGFVLFDGEIKKILKPKHGRDQVLTIIRSLDSCAPSIPGSTLTQALTATSQILRSKSLVIILSDFRIAGFEKALGQLARKHDVVAVRLVSPIDFKLPKIGLVPFRDPETKSSLLLPTDSQSFQTHWGKEAKESVLRWRTMCLRQGLAPFLLSTEDDAAKTFASFFASRKEVLSAMHNLENRL